MSLRVCEVSPLTAVSFLLGELLVNFSIYSEQCMNVVVVVVVVVVSRAIILVE